MAPSEQRTRIVIAVTEPTEVGSLWRAALQRQGSLPAELLAVFLSDDRWLRAASLPFTREVPRFGGASVDFTPARAERLSRDVVHAVERSLRDLARQARLPFLFRALSDSELQEIIDFVGEGNTILIASSRLVRQPVYAQITKGDWRVELVDVPEEPPETV